MDLNCYVTANVYINNNDSSSRIYVVKAYNEDWFKRAGNTNQSED